MAAIWAATKTYIPCIDPDGLSDAESAAIQKQTRWGEPEVKQRYIYFKQFCSSKEMNKEEVCVFRK